MTKYGKRHFSKTRELTANLNETFRARSGTPISLQTSPTFAGAPLRMLLGRAIPARTKSCWAAWLPHCGLRSPMLPQVSACRLETPSLCISSPILREGVAANIAGSGPDAARLHIKTRHSNGYTVSPKTSTPARNPPPDGSSRPSELWPFYLEPHEITAFLVRNSLAAQLP
jgi:hypothetical protein